METEIRNLDIAAVETQGWFAATIPFALIEGVSPRRENG
jgi:hypothetical protein